MQITWPWPQVGRFSHDLITLQENVNLKLWNFSESLIVYICAQYISMRPHGIDCKQIWIESLILMFEIFCQI